MTLRGAVVAPATSGTPCKVGQLLASDALSADDTQLLDDWLARRWQVSAETLAQALTREGHRTGPSTLKQHRLSSCACYR